jgi:hypothetical protein
LREWKGCSPLTVRLLGWALTLLIAAVLAIAYGNYLASASTAS